MLTVLNVAPASADWNKSLFATADIVCPNEHEAEIISGLDTESSGGAEAAAKAMLELMGGDGYGGSF